MSGAVDETLMQTIALDSFGAQIIDVLFYDAEGLIVTPTSGFYSIQYTPNKRVWIDFEGAQFPAMVDRDVEDWQASGYIEQIRAVPVDIVGAVDWEVKYRTHGIGMPSNVGRSLESNRYFSASNVVTYNDFEFATLQGKASATSQFLTVPANTSYSIKVIKNADSSIQFASANGLFISYVDGHVTGDLVAVSTGDRLNNLEPNPFQASFEYYDGPAVGVATVTEKDRVSTTFIVNGGGVIELINTTASPIETYFSCGQVALGEQTIPFMLTADTLITATTEMSDYNGTN